MATSATGDSELAPAKVNLALHVTGRRDDGYHLIEGLVVFADSGDRLRLLPAAGGEPALSVKGPFAGALDKATSAADNLALRAVDALLGESAGRRRKPVRLLLTKRLPVAAGLGGGSADAAAALRLVNRRFRLRLGADELARIGLRLGADVPMCLVSRPLLAEGVGERVTPVPAM
ncbi:MAG: 4-(cytidine 5'-diphospho)-2-C-methyl-D-erythritol kinase, partial [Bauldia sp.]